MEPVPIYKRLSVNIAEAVALTGIGRNQIDWWIKNDIKFPSFKVGTKTMIPVKMLEQYLSDMAKMRVGETVHSPRIAQIMARRGCS